MQECYPSQVDIIFKYKIRFEISMKQFNNKWDIIEIVQWNASKKNELHEMINVDELHEMIFVSQWKCTLDYGYKGH